ncbi:Radical SAM, alpha/beta horseshoe [Syntrophomonas zehnderi OL-4]|uniref:Radical SAM, alpha/beta horseshoe n=1 Tax=Syntrophomonas zehnderi OL-4 TaxID=690567 RepID=A0A0E4GDK3_9FIRM|nr:radical SAM protein [Syntrophomonas zehnderi]CFY11246.1 Radical SAM, alpha/beta horseshoe [Syntrophomonas zehnderi OL-4]
MRYEGQIFRPFSEANSYLLQCTIGCSHNRCTFCGMYKDKKYRVRSMEEIKNDIKMARQYYGDVEKVFLCDGDAIAIDTDMLLEILAELYKSFPSLRHVGTYAGPNSTLKKSLSELSALRASGLTKAYLGVETGDEDLLKQVNKGVTYDEMLQTGRNLINSGINLSAMVLLGLAGKGIRSQEHALATARITNEMKPAYLAALTVTPVPGTVLFRQVQEGEFQLLDAFETLEEMKTIFNNITIDNLKFVGSHASNYLPIQGTLQQDKAAMVNMVDQVLESRDTRYLRSEKMRGL